MKAFAVAAIPFVLLLSLIVLEGCSSNDIVPTQNTLPINPEPETQPKNDEGNKTEALTKIPESPTKLETSGTPAPPADQALAEITIISQNNDEWKIKVDKIRDYIRYPNAKNPALKEGEEISIYVNGFLDTFEYRGPVCPSEYVKSPKPAEAQSQTGEPSTRPIPKVVVGDIYLSKLFGCYAELNCGKLGWSGYLFNSNPVVVEHECVMPDPGVPPSTKPQGALPSVEPKQ